MECTDTGSYSYFTTGASRLKLAADPEKPACAAGDGYFSLHMRRYLGCKTRLLPRIAEVVARFCPEVKSVLDVFAGTGVVAHLFNTPERRIVVNDFLYSNFAVLLPWFTARPEDKQAVEAGIDELRGVVPRSDNYYSKNYGERFFENDTARKIGAIREKISAIKGNRIVRYAALSSLLYASDYVALTCGHFDAYRGLKERARTFRMRYPAIPYESNFNNEVFKADGNQLVREVETDLLYVDPPYNKRQYGTLYHVLDNIAFNDKPKLAGKTRKMSPSRRPRSLYCTSKAPEALKDLISSCRAKHLLVSYNNMSTGGASSNAILSREKIQEILKTRGGVKTFHFPFPSFTARRKRLPGHGEYLFYCRVGKGS